jgi:RND family efflux transporter MFP subunit
MKTITARIGAVAALLAAGGWPLSAAANPYDCLIEPSQTVDVRSSTEGVIEKVFVQRGDRVRAGQVLVQLESAVETSAVEMARHRAEATGRLATAQNRLDYANKKLQRSEQLQSQNFISQQARDEAEAEKKILESELREAREGKELAAHEHRHSQNLLNRRVLRSPFNGIVLDRMLNPGDLAESGTGRKPILRLVQIEPLRVEVVLPMPAYGRIKHRSTAEVTAEGLGGAMAATVSVVDSVFDTASGTFGVRLELPNAGGRVPAGIRCRVDFPGLRDLPPKASLMRGTTLK